MQSVAAAAPWMPMVLVHVIQQYVVVFTMLNFGGRVTRAAAASDTTDCLAISWPFNVLPTESKWTTGTTMPRPRTYSSAAVLDDVVYVTGGFNFVRIANVDCYRVSCGVAGGGVWSPTSPLLTPRCTHITVACAGLLYVIGGEIHSRDAVACAEVFDPHTEHWSPIASMNVARTYHAGVVFQDIIYIFGGMNCDDDVHNALKPSAECYDPRTNTWKMISPPLTARGRHRAVVLENGIIAIMGGCIYTAPRYPEITAGVELYNPVIDKWTVAPWSLPSPLCEFAVFTMCNQLIVSEGDHKYGGDFTTNQVGNLTTWQWSPAPRLPDTCHGAAFTQMITH